MWEEHLEFGVRHVKFEMPSGLTSKWKCQVVSEIFEPGAQARGQREEMGYINTQPELLPNLAKTYQSQDVFFFFCNLAQHRAKPAHLMEQEHGQWHR